MKRAIALKHKMQRQEKARTEALAHPYIKKTWLSPFQSALTSLRDIEVEPNTIRRLSQVTALVVGGAALAYLVAKMGPRPEASESVASGQPEPVQKRAPSDLDAAVAP